MAKYNFYISYSRQDMELANHILTSLENMGYSVFIDTMMEPGTKWTEELPNALANSDCIVTIITDHYLVADGAAWEMQKLRNIALHRAKKVVPLFFTDQALPLHLSWLAHYQGFYLSGYPDIDAAVEKIDRQIGQDFKEASLYDKLSEYRNLKHAVKEAETLCQLVELLCDKWQALRLQDRRGLCMELCRLLEQLEHNSCPYSQESKAVCPQMMAAVRKAVGLLGPEDPGSHVFLQDIFFIAFAVRLKYLDWQVRTEAVDLHTGGDVQQGIIDPFPIEQYIANQLPYVQAFEAALDREQDTPDADSRFSAEELEFIKQTFSYVLSRDKHGIPPLIPRSRQEPSVSADDDVLLSAAKILQESNKLFYTLQARGISGDYAKCLLTSYERLKNYCQIVGAADIAAECVDRIVDIRDRLIRQESASVSNEKAENGLRSLLGLTLHGSGNYDVFISYKSQDADLAEKIYLLCQRHMKVPFWSKRTLPELSKSEYEDAIYAALRNSKHFVVVLSSLEYLDALWVKREMKTFDRAITEGRKPDGNFVFVVTDTVYDDIINQKKICLDERYCGYQILKMSEYEKTLMQYIS